MATKTKFNKETDWLRKLNKYLQRNLDNKDLTNELIARHFAISTAQFYRRVKRLTQQSPNQYIRAMRLAKAQKIMVDGKVTTVKEVAYRVGFYRVDYFSKLYEEQYGLRPKQLLKNID